MKKMYLIVTVMAALVLLLSACSPEAEQPERTTAMPADEMTATTMPADGMTATATADTGAATSLTATVTPATAMTAVLPNTGGGPANVMIGKNDKLGSFLEDDKGMTLYMFTKDTPNTSTCYNKCATSWLPLLTTGNPVAATGIDASKLGTTKRTDGSMQVTYAGWPLYYFAQAAQAGDTTGQNVSGVWFVISPEGTKITK